MFDRLKGFWLNLKARYLIEREEYILALKERQALQKERVLIHSIAVMVDWCVKCYIPKNFFFQRKEQIIYFGKSYFLKYASVAGGDLICIGNNVDAASGQVLHFELLETGKLLSYADTRKGCIGGYRLFNIELNTDLNGLIELHKALWNFQTTHKS